MPEGGYGSAQTFDALARSAQLATFHLGQFARQVAVVQATVGTLRFAVGTFAQLEQTLTLTNNAAQGTAQTFKAMENAVRSFALVTRTSANEGASALYYLSQAGLSTQQAMSAMNGVLLLSQATLTDVSTNADLLASSLVSFKLQASEASRVANLFAASTTNSLGSMDKLAFSMRQVAPVAGALGVSIEDTVASLSLLYNVGLRGEQAGTALRNTLIRLVNPTQKAQEVLVELGVSTRNLDGSMRNLRDILGDLAKAAPSTGVLKTIVEDEALAGAQALISAADAMEFKRRLLSDTLLRAQARGVAERTTGTVLPSGLSDAEEVERITAVISDNMQLMRLQIVGTNEAFRLSAAQMNTLSSTMKVANNSIVELGITLGQQLAPMLTTVFRSITDFVIWFRNLDAATRQLMITIPAMAGAFYITGRAALFFLDKMRDLANLNLGTLLTSLTDRFKSLNTAVSGTAAAAAAANAAAAGGGAAAGAVAGSWGTRALAGASTLIGGAGVVAAVLLIGREIVNAIRATRETQPSVASQDIGGDLRRQTEMAAITGASNPVEAVANIQRIRSEALAQFDANLAQTEAIKQETVRYTENALRILKDAAQQAGVSERNIAKIDQGTAASTLASGSTDAYRSLTAAGMSSKDAIAINNILKRNKDMQKVLADAVAITEQNKANAAKLAENRATVNKSLDASVIREQSIRATPGYTEAEDAAEDTARRIKEQEEKAKDQFRLLFQDDFLRAMDADKRALEARMQRLRAVLTDDLVRRDMVEIYDKRQEIARGMQSDADAASERLTKMLQDFEVSIPSFSALLTGQDYRQLSFVQNADGKMGFQAGQLRDGFIKRFQQGEISREQLLEEWRSAVEVVISNLGSQNPEAAKAAQKLFESVFKNLDTATGEGFDLALRQLSVESRERGQDRATMQRAMTARLEGLKNDVLDALKDATRGFDFTVNFASGFEELRAKQQQLVEQLINVFEQFFKNADLSSVSADRIAEFQNFRDQFIGYIRQLYDVQLKNLLRETKDAQLKALDDIKSTNADLEASNATIARELAILGDRSGLELGISSSSLTRIAEQTSRIAQLRALLRGMAAPTPASALPRAPMAPAGLMGAYNQVLGPVPQVPPSLFSPQDRINNAGGAISPYGSGAAGAPGLQQYLGQFGTQFSRDQFGNDLAERKLGLDRASIQTTAELQTKVEGLAKAQTNVAGATKESQAATTAYQQLQAGSQVLIQREIEQRLRLIELIKAQQETPGFRAYEAHKIDMEALQLLEQQYERTGTAIDGVRIQMQRTMLELKTDAQLGAEAFKMFVEDTSTILSGLIVGTETDWKASVRTMLQEISQMIIKAMIMRAIMFAFNAAGMPMPLPVAPTGTAPVPRQFGGPMSAGKVYKVHKDELIVPTRSSFAIPGSAALAPRGGGGGGYMYAPTMSFSFGSDGTTSGRGNSAAEQDQMSKELERGVEQTVLAIFQKHSRSGGQFNSTSQRFKNG